MHTMTAGYRGLSLLFQLNWDRLFYVATIAAALMGGAALGSFIAPAGVLMTP